MAIVEVSIVPIGVAGTSLSRYVAETVKVLQGTSLDYQVTAMGTIISGDLGTIWEALQQMHESCFEQGAVRVLTQIKMDDRRDRVASPEQKVHAVMDKLPHGNQ